MYYSEFTLKLIDEVKKREILYNTKYDKRPKPEKEEAWKEIADNLESTPDKCKKHWKNVRDRFVKVMHLRDRHFLNKGSELNAPQYIYYDKVSFMREFSIKKETTVESSSLNDIMMVDISPEPLVYEENKGPDGSSSLFDCTERFLELVKDYPILYDENAEMRKYRAKNAWKQIAEDLFGKFTIGQLRQYWITLMKKYKLYLEHAHTITVENEALFSYLSFANESIHLKSDGKHSSPSSEYILLEDEVVDNKDFLEELNDESHLLCEVVDSSLHEPSTDDESIAECEIPELPDTESFDEITEPESKKRKSNTEIASSKSKPDAENLLSTTLTITASESLSVSQTSSSASSHSLDQQKSSNLPFLETLAPTMDSLPLSAQLRLRAKFMNLLAEEVAKLEQSA